MDFDPAPRVLQPRRTRISKLVFSKLGKKRRVVDEDGVSVEGVAHEFPAGRLVGLEANEYGETV